MEGWREEGERDEGNRGRRERGKGQRIEKDAIVEGGREGKEDGGREGKRDGWRGRRRGQEISLGKERVMMKVKNGNQMRCERKSYGEME